MPIIAINKPLHYTSHDVVARVRQLTQVKKVGHAGTLDPLARGVLVIGIGRESTRLLTGIMHGGKTYEAEVTLGKNSTTEDTEGELTVINESLRPTKEMVDEKLKTFIGTIQQAPPAYSAINVGGKRAYTLARAGKKVNLGFRTVTIHQIEVLDYAWPVLSIRVECESGVYIRSLARDIGKALGTGAYMSALTRTRVGEYTLDKALSFDNLDSLNNY